MIRIRLLFETVGRFSLSILLSPSEEQHSLAQKDTAYVGTSKGLFLFWEKALRGTPGLVYETKNTARRFDAGTGGGETYKERFFPVFCVNQRNTPRIPRRTHNDVLAVDSRVRNF
jgi:hypothetical protein